MMIGMPKMVNRMNAACFAYLDISWLLCVAHYVRESAPARLRTHVGTGRRSSMRLRRTAKMRSHFGGHTR
ncbi:hypothetical protein FTUN_2055 [Frigoriglobus tundricola]|uniref:Uncharacterized protein n=1 Tax=Frigoriglobus tundricola TaxID=2774151 RepID=A0A6M5YLS1_9BACT|nr:hypothetical protein FTUN_2055 [Frigoriglobus tundricola]